MVYIMLFYGFVMILLMDDFMVFVDFYFDIIFNMNFMNDICDFIRWEVDVLF